MEVHGGDNFIITVLIDAQKIETYCAFAIVFGILFEFNLTVFKSIS
jgi:hypothetical protein